MAIPEATGPSYARSEVKRGGEVKDWIFTSKGPPKFESCKVVDSTSGVKRD